MKHIIFGGFDYAVLWEMDQDAVYRGIDYFVDNDPARIGTTHMGKPIKAPEALLAENPDDMLILIGSIIYKTELAFQLQDMGFKEDKNYIWAISFCGDEKCPRLWRSVAWNDRDRNAINLRDVESGEYHLSRLKAASRFIGFDSIDTVIDLGAANGRMRAFIPENIRYIPVDYMPYSDETIVCDFNKDEFPNAEKLQYNPARTCILCIGCIHYVQHWKLFLRRVSENCAATIINHNDFACISREYRRERWTGNAALFNYEIILQMLKYGFKLVDAVDFRLRSTIYAFEKVRGQ